MSTPTPPPPEKKKRGPWYLALFALLGALFGHFYAQRAIDHDADDTPHPAQAVQAALEVARTDIADAGTAEPMDAGDVEATAPPTPGSKPSLTTGFCAADDLEPAYARPSLHAYVMDHVEKTDHAALAQAEFELGMSHRFAPDGGLVDPGVPDHARPFVEREMQDHADRAASWVLRFELDQATENLRNALEDIQHAESLDPNAAALPLAEAELLRVSGDAAGAGRALEAYVKLQPGDGRMKRRAALLGVEADIEADYRSANIGGLVVRTTPEFAQANDLERVLETIRDEREQAAHFTGFPARDPLSVVILPSRTELMAMSCVNEWAGGYYDGTIKLIEGPNHALPKVELRHELVHAVALSRLPSDRPLWFTEGLADYFSTPKKLHAQKEKLLAMNHTLIPIDSLVGTLQIMNTADAELAYAESDVLVALMIDERGLTVVPEALHKLEARADPTQLDALTLGHPISSEAFFQLLEKRMGSSTAHEALPR